MRQRRNAIGLLMLLLLSGCSGIPTTHPPRTYPVHGKVLMPDGRPLHSATITFHAKEKPGNDAMSLIDKDGSFALGTFAKDDGAIPGAYVVTVSPLAARPAGGIPKKFLDEDSSPWKVTVSAGENQLPVFTMR